MAAYPEFDGRGIALLAEGDEEVAVLPLTLTLTLTLTLHEGDEEVACYP